MTATVVVGVGAGIAAYKMAQVVRDLMRGGHDVTVVPTPASLSFVGAATWEALSGHPAHSGVFEAGGADHVEIARRAELVLVAPATADLLARLRLGMADDLLTTTVLAATCPVVVAPAMHTAMWQDPATRENVRVLRQRGITVLDPAEGALSSGDTGVGRLPDPEVLVRAALEALGERRSADAQDHPLHGVRILVTAGGTREAIDPVRFLGNRSSGRQGCAVAAAALALGAEVTLVLANVDPGLVPEGVRVVHAPSAASMEEAVTSRLGGTDVLVMAAAVADFRPRETREEKIKKDPSTDDAPVITLERTTDILAESAHSPHRPRVVVGFAAETGSVEDVLARGREKAERKGADLLAVNAVGAGLGFGDVDNTLHLLDAHGEEVATITGSKESVARDLVDQVRVLLGTMSR
ncbi:bifunctional phosphopantothenoylcysteine decarboxylase/phosphopantothenate--cysteine ligase CoaBC [Actinomyces provencensis]|uniref:bifunctional phosphopantothenoylcysteine decarboxylase/phosphopantothenate--cysteine ligase CoaBC n=1 Tax=Actinomyces provencensis TaxID=1720198 RepID=UPI00096A9220|nr:bifunctional phosphopantothenoylcysteine decarboxylase/phosphopantothenate--cysteine ligase CoaBC [Actinomyces provencensis]